MYVIKVNDGSEVETVVEVQAFSGVLVRDRSTLTPEELAQDPNKKDKDSTVFQSVIIGSFGVVDLIRTIDSTEELITSLKAHALEHAHKTGQSTLGGLVTPESILAFLEAMVGRPKEDSKAEEGSDAEEGKEDGTMQ